MTADSAPSDDAIIRITGKIGSITLNRPHALNALTQANALDIEAALDRWRVGKGVSAVLIEGTGDKAFCAGGDVQEIYHAGLAGDFAYGRAFWAQEYRLNAKISRYPLRYVAVMDGITMGGGVGVSVHGSHRIATERSVIALPECAIGLIPDVGSSYVLSRAPGRLGEFLALTGYRMNAADAIFAGLADMYIPSQRCDAMVAELVSSGDATGIAAYAEPAETSELADLQPEIDVIFARSTIGDVLDALEASSKPWAQTAQKALRRAAPLSLGAALRTIRAARDVETIEDALALEYRFTYRSQTEGDFIEGTRALIIDKDRSPKWRVEQIEDLEETAIDPLVAPLGADELTITR